MSSTEENLEHIQEPITQAPKDVKEIIERVLQLEKERQHQKIPRHVNEDILCIIKEVIQ